ncbi:MAG: hypothetical protein R6T89_04885 [Candidatus Syntrophosphaera sp.]
MSRYWIVILLIFPVLITAQSLNDDYMFPGDETWQDPVYDIIDHPEYSLGGMLGTIMIDGTTYTQFRLRPEVAIWKLGLGMDIDLLFDGDGKLRRKGWESWEDILGKLFYLRFADRSDSLYFKIGCIPDYTLEHGFIFDDYSNMLRYPNEKPIGGYFGINTNSYGFAFEVYTHDISRNDIFAGRASLNPLQSTNIPLVKNITVGANFGGDRNPQGKYPDQDGDGYPDVYDKFPDDPLFWLDTDDDGTPDSQDLDLNGNSILDHPDLNPYVDEVFPGIAENYPDYPFDTAVYPDSAAQYAENEPMYIYSFDYGLPIVENDVFSLLHYGEYAVMKDHGRGLIFPGLASRFMMFDAKVELRALGSEFIPGYFDNLYDEQRCQVVHRSLDEENGRMIYYLETKDAILEDVDFGWGWFGYLKANVTDIGHIKAAYQDMFGGRRSRGKSLWCKITAMPAKLPKLKEASLYYAQTNVDRIDLKEFRNVNSQLSGRLVYGYNEYYSLVCKYTEYYTDLNSDGKIRGEDEVVESIILGIDFQF